MLIELNGDDKGVLLELLSRTTLKGNEVARFSKLVKTINTEYVVPEAKAEAKDQPKDLPSESTN